ncbi:uncharacterized protein N7496_000193 [Penicillium cataractarum]|uniref:Uncharacterized protein n=1 Tax=Penicillium cataractarum TaxID=2100454 RepID=A0A9W9VTX1_9EURO|nr:uncharacterized protein N7496_000193 [Penicillium cataractarum]KAJ5389125.1 hypothetical protein N7496_000193 [Penicillium cataractarum]
MESLDPPPYYGDFQERGRKLQKWIDNPSEAECPIQPSTLTYAQLADWIPINERHFEIGEIINSMCAVNGQEGVEPGPWTVHNYDHDAYTPGGTATGNHNTWESHVAPGIAFLALTFRDTGPHASQIVQACYERVHPISTLNHVVVSDIINDHTLDFIRYILFPGIPALLAGVPKTFAYGTAEYEALLGTRCGLMVGYLLLGAYERGTRRISRITVDIPQAAGVYLQFDIEDINPVSSPSTRGSKRRRGESDEDGEYEEGPKKRRRSPKTPPPPYDGPARRTRQAVGAVEYTITPKGQPRKLSQ